MKWYSIPDVSHLRRRAVLFSVLAPVCALCLCSCAELEYLRYKADLQDQTIAQMESKLREWQDAYDNLMNQHTKDVQEYQKQLALRDQEIRRLRSDKTDRERELERQLNELKLRAQAEIDKNLKAAKEAESLQNKLMTADKQLTSAKITQSQLEKDLAAARAEIAALKSQLQTLEQARIAADKRTRAVEAERDRLKGEVEAGAAQIAALERDVKDLRIAAKAADDSKTTISAQVAEISKQLADERKAAEAERSRLKAEISRLSGQLAKVQGAAAGASDAGLSRAKDALEKVVAAQIKDKSAEVETAADRVVLRLRSDALFEPATLRLVPSAQTTLRQIAEVLAKFPGYQLRVEGHTDNQPVRDLPFPDNLALSTQRAYNVLRFLLESAKLPQKQIRSIGCADYQPIAPNDTAEGRARNRRVEIVLCPVE
ncbi:MAG: OmpA family protein [Candidatus Sumerlaeia bacterium]|nr:OmpA family protein [Candidatus Sumerlaeia bacterium]